MVNKNQIIYCFFLVIFMFACSKDKSSENNIIGFYLPNRQHEVRIENNEIVVFMHDTQPVTNMVPVIEVSNKAWLSPVSNVARDFSKDVYYTVTAENGDKRIYVVKVRSSSDNALISFSIPNQTFDVFIDGLDVSVDMYRYVDISKLTPIVVVSDGATINPPSGSMVDFTEPVIYVVTALDGSVAEYTVTINKNLSRRNDIEDFRLVGTQQIFEREGDNLYIYVPYETDMTNIKTDIVVSDMATVSPTSGAIMDFTEPQIYTVTASDGSEKDFWVTVKRSPWRWVKDRPWTLRDGAGLVEFKGKMWLLGGWNHGWDNTHNYVQSEVWNSSDGINWERLPDAPWTGRHGGGYVVFDDAIWVISGANAADVWKSEDGINWTLVTDTAPWGRRYVPYIAVFKNKLWLMGGMISSILFNGMLGIDAFNDVWSSVDGKNWILEIANASWAPRGLIHGYVVLNDELYIMGGGIKGDVIGISETIIEYNDVWKTSDGILWTRVLQHTPWSQRTHFSVTTYNGNIIVNDGSVGTPSGLSNETWYSSNGRDWKQVKYSFWRPTHASGLCVFKNKLCLASGYQFASIWSLDFNDL